MSALVKAFPAQDADKFTLRLVSQLRENIKAQARQNCRSMNSEIIAVLQAYYGRSGAMPPEVQELVACLRACLAEIDQEIEQRKFGGNDEDWAALAELSDRGHAAVRMVEDAA
jgi:hypothetical protein